MLQLFGNNAYSFINGALLDTDTSLDVSPGTGSRFPTITGSDYFLLTLISLDNDGNEDAWEVVKVTAVSTDTLTIVRAQEGTTALDWLSGLRVELRLTAGTMTSHESKLGNSLALAGLLMVSGAALSWDDGDVTLTHSTGKLALNGALDVTALTASGTITQTGPTKDAVFGINGSDLGYLTHNGGTVYTFSDTTPFAFTSNVTVGGTLDVTGSISTSNFLALNNAKAVTFKDTDGTDRVTLQIFSDNNTYLDAYGSAAGGGNMFLRTRTADGVVVSALTLATATGAAQFRGSVSANGNIQASAASVRVIAHATAGTDAQFRLEENGVFRGTFVWDASDGLTYLYGSNGTTPAFSVNAGSLVAFGAAVSVAGKQTSSGIVRNTTAQTYEAGVLGYSTAGFGFIFRPPQAGATAAHKFQQFDGSDILTLTEAGAATFAGTLGVAGVTTLTSGMVRGLSSQTYQAGVLGYTDGNQGFLYRPPRAGADFAHNFQSFAGAALLTVTEAGAVAVAGSLDVAGVTTATEAINITAPISNRYLSNMINTFSTAGESFGLRVQAGTNTTDRALIVYDHDAANTLFSVDGAGNATHLGSLAVAGVTTLSNQLNVNVNTTGAVPGNAFGGSIGFNYTSGGGEVDFFNSYRAAGNGGFDFWQVDAAGNPQRLLQLTKAGAANFAGPVVSTGLWAAPSFGQGKLIGIANDGAVIAGNGTNNDITLVSKNGTHALRVPTGTTNVVIGGTMTVASSVNINTTTAGVPLQVNGDSLIKGNLAVGDAILGTSIGFAAGAGIAINGDDVANLSLAGGSGTGTGNYCKLAFSANGSSAYITYGNALGSNTGADDLDFYGFGEIFLNLPTSSGTTGSLWNNGGTVKVS
jgi:hypothetical protein